MDRVFVSLIIPAFNEESYIGPTLDAINAAIAHSDVPDELRVEVIVVDNGSTDSTADLARSKGASVVDEPQGNVATARNAGARFAHGNVLVFVDADIHWPSTVLSRIVEIMEDESCVGGAVDTEYRPQSAIIQIYLQFWRVFSKLFHMAQGATQFCTAEAFESVAGYNESVFMGEDVDFYFRLRRYAKSKGCFVNMIEDVRVVPSCRKFDKWPIWKTLLLTNPVICLLFSRSRRPWGDWYTKPTR